MRAPRKFGRGWEDTPEVWEGSGGHPGSPGGLWKDHGSPGGVGMGREGPGSLEGFGRAFRKLGRGQEGTPEVREGSERPRKSVRVRYSTQEVW